MKQFYTSFSKKLFFVIATLSLVITTNTTAQCVQPYKVFESFKATAVPIGSTATAPIILGAATVGVVGADSWRVFGNATTISNSISHSGRSSFSFNINGGYLITPRIVSPSSGTMSLGFYYKNITAGTSQLIVEYSTNYPGGGADPALSTWTTLGSPPNPAGTAYAATPLYTFSPGPTGGYIRIRRANAGTIIPNIDSLSWYSSDATENLQLVLPVVAPSTCTYNISTGLVYRFFDSGGFDDNFNNTASAINSVTFMPPTGKQINLKFISWVSAAIPVANIVGTDTDVPLNHSLNALPTVLSYLSSKLDGSIKTDYKTTNNTAAGFEITIEAKDPVSTCSDVSGVTFTTGSETSSSAAITWTAPGAVPSGGYDYYVATTATPLPTALTTPTGNVSNSLPSATVTGLLSDTTYFVWVRSNCGGNLGSWKQGATSIKTLCSPFPIPYTENFNGLNGPIPTCTSRVRAWATNISNGSLFTNDISTAPYPMFISKPVSLDAGTTYRLSYDYSTTVGSGTANFNVYYGTTDAPPTQANINTLLASYVGVSSLTGNIVNFTAPSSGTFYIGFLLQGFSIPSTTVFNLDNVVLDVEQCLPPTAVSNSGISFTEATVSWMAPASAPTNGYQYLVTTSSTAPTYTDPPTGTTSAGVTSVNLALTPGTTYYVWVRSNCGGTYSIWASTNFTTPALPLSTGVTMSNGSLTICGTSTFGSAVFFDSGGSLNTYAINEDFTYTFRPNVAGSKLKVVFSSFNTENRYDGLSIYNGPNTTTSPLISSGLPAGTNAVTCPAGSFYGTNSPGTIFSSSPNGEITFKFTSDFSINNSGWAATVTCVIVPVISSFTPSDNSCNPTTTPTLVTLTGSNFSGATSVKFNGVSSSFTVVNANTITATLPAGASTGIISVSNVDATGFSTTSFTVFAPAPNATGSTICASTEPGVLSSTTDCAGFVSPVSTISGAWAATDPIANRPAGSTNSTACGFTAATPRGYTSIQFQVSQTGTYTFQMANDTNFDGMGYITSGAFVPGSCATGNFIIGDDDSGVNEPRMSAVLTAGVTYTLYSTYWTDIAPTYYSYTWNISTTSSGQVLLYDTAPVAWFTAASGGTAIGTGSPFNPVGVPGSGLTTSSLAGNYTFYAACPSNPTCRKAVVIVVKPAPSVIPPANASVCPNTIKALTVSGTANTYTWSSSVANTLYSDVNATLLYVPGTSANTVYLKTGSTAVVTITGAQPASCSTIVTTTQTVQSKIWNGSAWVGGAPTATDGIIINGNGSAFGSLQGCSCTVTNGNVVFNNGETLTILNDLTVTGGTLTFENGASLVQLNTPSSNTNMGNIVYKRNTSMRKFDYTYWSSPVGSQTLFNLSQNTLPDKFFSWNAITYSWTQLPAPTTFMDPGRGYIIRGPQGFSSTVLTAFTGTFQGIPNNGNYSVFITKSALGDLNLIGNPYPSAVEASAFILGNPTVFGGGTTLYFWTHNTPITNNVYTDSDYAVWNFSGGTGTGTGVAGANNTPPSGKIAAGQGFMVKGINLGTQTATFRNNMRIAGNNTNFYRMQEDFYNERDAMLLSQSTAIEGLERHRIWLDLTSDQGVFKEVLLAYVDNATNNYEEAFDGDVIDIGESVGFYSLLSSHKLAIQGRVLPFDEGDIIPLGLQLPIAGSYNIQLSNFDGLFADTNTPVYLEDQLMHVVHNLRQGSYTFVSESGTFDQRFVIRFTNNLLQVPVSDFDENSVVVFKNNNIITVQSSNLLMKEVNLYDVRGRLIMGKNNLETDKVIFDNLSLAQQVLLVHITTENGSVVVKKIIF